MWNLGGQCESLDSQFSVVISDNPDNDITACTAGNCTCRNLIQNCNIFGFMYANNSCTGTPVGQRNPTGVTILGCCKWNGEQCWNIMSDDDSNGSTANDKVKMCIENDISTFYDRACPTTDGTCPY
jgi:hypothetical protein